jgi:hypothetical protein
MFLAKFQIINEGMKQKQRMYNKIFLFVKSKFDFDTSWILFTDHHHRQTFEHTYNDLDKNNDNNKKTIAAKAVVIIVLPLQMWIKFVTSGSRSGDTNHTNQCSMYLMLTCGVWLLEISQRWQTATIHHTTYHSSKLKPFNLRWLKVEHGKINYACAVDVEMSMGEVFDGVIDKITDWWMRSGVGVLCLISIVPRSNSWPSVTTARTISFGKGLQMEQEWFGPVLAETFQ